MKVRKISISIIFFLGCLCKCTMQLSILSWSFIRQMNFIFKIAISLYPNVYKIAKKRVNVRKISISINFFRGFFEQICHILLNIIVELHTIDYFRFKKFLFLYILSVYEATYFPYPIIQSSKTLTFHCRFKYNCRTCKNYIKSVDQYFFIEHGK